MRRRKPDPDHVGYPPRLAVFDATDWWVRDLEDPLEVAYARIGWAVARRAYAAGEDWQSFLEPPVWWQHN